MSFQLFIKFFYPFRYTVLCNTWDLQAHECETTRNFKCQNDHDIDKPPAYFNYGSRETNIIHTKLRYACSLLNADFYILNKSPITFLFMFMSS